MILISHRGNLNGPQPNRENSPEFIDEAISLGYSVEIDLWVTECVEAPSVICLGHDHPQYEIDLPWLQGRKNYLWVHCKNRQAFDFCLRNNLHCFWHDTDDYTMTSWGYVWAYPGKFAAGPMCILVVPEKVWPVDLIKQQPAFGYCSDYVAQIKA